MLNMRKRPYSDISSSYGGVEDQVSARAGSDADLNPPGPNGMTSMPQGGPADLKFLLELPLACMTKDVRAAVQKAATASGKHTECPFLGVRRKQRSLEGAWTVTVTIEQTPTTIGGKFADEVVAARAHDLLVLLFCTGRAARRVNFQAWTYADELPHFKNLPLVEAIAKVKERQTHVFKYDEPWCQRPAESPIPHPKNAPPQHAAAKKRAACGQQNLSYRERTGTGAAKSCISAAAFKTQQQELVGTVGKYYVQGVFKPAQMSAGLHALRCHLESLLGPKLGADIPDGLDPPMEQAQQDAFLRRFRLVMRRMELSLDEQYTGLSPVEGSQPQEQYRNSTQGKGHNSKLPVLSPRLSMDENSNPNNL